MLFAPVLLKSAVILKEFEHMRFGIFNYVSEITYFCEVTYLHAVHGFENSNDRTEPRLL